MYSDLQIKTHVISAQQKYTHEAPHYYLATPHYLKS